MKQRRLLSYPRATEAPQRFREDLAFIRSKTGFKTCEIARALNVSRQSINCWQKGTREPSTINYLDVTRWAAKLRTISGRKNKKDYAGLVFSRESLLSEESFISDLAFIRKETGFKTGEIARALNVSRQSINYYEKGKKHPGIQTYISVRDWAAHLRAEAANNKITVQRMQ